MFPYEFSHYMAPGASEVIKIDREKATMLSKTILMLLKTEDALPTEAFGILETVRMSYVAAVLEIQMKERFGLVEVGK